jgi:hypothetical protein
MNHCTGNVAALGSLGLQTPSCSVMDMALVGLPGTLKTIGGHEIAPQHLSHHRDRFERAAIKSLKH